MKLVVHKSVDIYRIVDATGRKADKKMNARIGTLLTTLFPLLFLLLCHDNEEDFFPHLHSVKLLRKKLGSEPFIQAANVSTPWFPTHNGENMLVEFLIQLAKFNCILTKPCLLCHYIINQSERDLLIPGKPLQLQHILERPRVERDLHFSSTNCPGAR